MIDLMLTAEQNDKRLHAEDRAWQTREQASFTENVVRRAAESRAEIAFLTGPSERVGAWAFAFKHDDWSTRQPIEQLHLRVQSLGMSHIVDRHIGNLAGEGRDARLEPGEHIAVVEIRRLREPVADDPLDRVTDADFLRSLAHALRNKGNEHDAARLERIAGDRL